MTVQQLIELLQGVEDKNKEISINHHYSIIEVEEDENKVYLDVI